MWGGGEIQESLVKTKGYEGRKDCFESPPPTLLSTVADLQFFYTPCLYILTATCDAYKWYLTSMNHLTKMKNLRRKGSCFNIQVVLSALLASAYILNNVCCSHWWYLCWTRGLMQCHWWYIDAGLPARYCFRIIRGCEWEEKVLGSERNDKKCC